MSQQNQRRVGLVPLEGLGCAALAPAPQSQSGHSRAQQSSVHVPAAAQTAVPAVAYQP